MKTQTTKILRISTLILVLLATGTFAINAQTYKAAAGSEIKVSGTSNMHDWAMEAKSFTIDASLTLKNGALGDISSLSFTLPVTNLKSKDKLMDTRAYKALKSDEFKTISFKLKDASVLPQQKVKVVGNLTIGGETREISFISTYTVNADQSVTFKGSRNVKMSDHNIKAPTFMMGALKVGDLVDVDLQLKLNK